jgi:hypothetical protein
MEPVNVGLEVGVAVRVAVGVRVKVRVRVAVGVALVVAVRVLVRVAVTVRVCVGVRVTVTVRVALGVAVSPGVSVMVGTGVSVTVGESVAVAVTVGVPVAGVLVALAVAVAVSVRVRVTEAVGVLVGGSSPTTRMTPLLPLVGSELAAGPKATGKRLSSGRLVSAVACGLTDTRQVYSWVAGSGCVPGPIVRKMVTCRLAHAGSRHPKLGGSMPDSAELQSGRPGASSTTGASGSKSIWLRVPMTV